MSFLYIATAAILCMPAAAQPADWSGYGSVLGYLIPEERWYASPTLAADRGRLHLEARYNYENLDTGSFWIGRNFDFGRKLTLDLTPMIGGVAGQSNGVAPGLLCTLTYRRLTLDSQGEYLFELERSNSFFYTWTELSYAPLDWLRAGAVIQRTKAYQTQFDIQRGVLAGASFRRMDFTVYVFNPFWGQPATVLAAGFRF